MKQRLAGSLPVLMYHYVSDHPDSIAVSRAVFEDQCRTLAENGWRGVSLAEAEGFLVHGEPLPAKSVLMTFDDGYFDNCLYALPIMHRHGHQGVMFAVSGRLEEGEPRVSLKELLAGEAPDMPLVNMPLRGNALGHTIRQDVFCSGAEARLMEESGVFAVAAHSRGHLGVHTGPEYTSFVRPGHQRRTFYRTAREHIWGMPEFAVKPGLLHRAFLPSEELEEKVKSFVPQDYAEAAVFLGDAKNIHALAALVDSFSGCLGRMESDAERTARMRQELAGGKQDLENILGHPVTALCWPWGKYCPEALTLGQEAGFTLFFTTQEGSNPPASPLAVHRFKAKNKNGAWLLSRARIYSRPLLGRLYARFRV